MEKPIYSREHRRLLKLLREIRLEAGLRQVDLARRLKTRQGFISAYETGSRRLDLLELRMICKACGITLKKFIDRFES